MDLSSWEFKHGDFECQLIHSEIPEGKFYFRALPGNKLHFSASLKENINHFETATLSQHAPAWSAPISIEVSDIRVTPDSPLIFTQDVIEMLDAAQTSQWVHIALAGKNTSASYLLPTIRIQQSLTAFNRCRAKLPGMTFKEARTLSLPFAFGQSSLTPSQKDKLNAMVSYLKLDDRIATILIDGHTDSVGSAIANLNTSRARAEKVAETLETFGVTRDMIEVRAHGERYPIASNDTKEGQALNRRVTVRLVRGSEQVVPSDNKQREITNKTAAKVQ
ncbi:MotY family protein [Grimontia sp. NTOU-MAR1]|uniref:MotY family protein n=1 Tax=Grimontia sp. NTOU-MAR1 TaxID=3111011 RepID=UPI002DBE465B|nr:OmpA family protein [Grimontia sp. NTOU-MAR1]WRV98714.1 OmpA family protein [Grimontia sp. NTOU-MAR1]